MTPEILDELPDILFPAYKGLGKGNSNALIHDIDEYAYHWFVGPSEKYVIFSSTLRAIWFLRCIVDGEETWLRQCDNKEEAMTLAFQDYITTREKPNHAICALVDYRLGLSQHVNVEGLQELAQDAAQMTYDLKAMLEVALKALNELRDSNPKIVDQNDIVLHALTDIDQMAQESADYLIQRSLERMTGTTDD